MNKTVKVVRQVVLRYTVYGEFRQHVAETSTALLPIAIPFVDYDHGGFGQIVLRHQLGDTTVSGLPVYQ